MMEEIWKDIEGYGDIYEVSNMGRVRTKEHRDRFGRLWPAKIKSQRFTRDGYLRVAFPKKYKDYTIAVHRLVALAFVPGYFDGAQVNHRNEKRDDNRACNLEWCTNEYNQAYGGHNKRTAENNRMRSKPIAQYSKQGEFIRQYASAVEASEATGANRQLICRVLDTKYRAKGFLWKSV